MAEREGDFEVPLAAVCKLLDSLEDDSAVEPAVVAPLAGFLDDAALTAIAERVRRIRLSLFRWRRRDQELSALFSSARELAELRDVDALLDRLVARAHDLMGTDVTYLSEFYQDTDELRVRSTLGTISPSMPQLRVPPGVGLASKVVRTRSPQWTSLYDSYRDVPHEEHIDAAVHEEGLVSLLGVPMMAGDRVLGVLFAANRSEHAFAPEEIALLSAFADHAAVVLQTTRLLAQARESAEAAQAANADLARTMAAMERASAVHQDLTEAVLRGGTASEVARTLAQALGRSVQIFDRELAPLSSAGEEGDHETSPAAPLESQSVVVREAVARSRSTGHCVFPEGPGPAAVVAVVAGDTLLGAILVGQGELDLGAVEQRTIERAAQIAALLVLKQEAVTEAEERVRGELIGDILRAGSSPATALEELVLRARARGVRLDRLRMVTVVLVPRELRRRAIQAVQSWRTGILVGEHVGYVVVISEAEDPVSAADSVRKAIHPTVGTAVLAVSGPQVGSYVELGPRFELLHRCAELLTSLDIRDEAVNAEAYQPYLALFGSRREEIVAFTEAVLGPVLRWDEDRGTDLLSTLSRFVESQASPAKAARALNVHINTLTQRLDRITALLGHDWRDPEPFFRIAIATRMHELASRPL